MLWNWYRGERWWLLSTQLRCYLRLQSVKAAPGMTHLVTSDKSLWHLLRSSRHTIYQQENQQEKLIFAFFVCFLSGFFYIFKPIARIQGATCSLELRSFRAKRFFSVCWCTPLDLKEQNNFCSCWLGVVIFPCAAYYSMYLTTSLCLVMAAGDLNREI